MFSKDSAGEQSAPPPDNVEDHLDAPDAEDFLSSDDDEEMSDEIEDMEYETETESAITEDEDNHASRYHIYNSFQHKD